MNRRIWLQRVLHLMGIGVGGAIAVPVIGNVLSPIFERRRGEHWHSLGPLDEFDVGTVTKSVIELPVEVTGSQTLRRKGVFVWRRTEDEVVVYARNCTDLSCPVTWDEGSGWFYCPCHGGIFTIEGEPVAGPPDRPLYRYDVRVADGVVEIDLDSLPSIT